MHIQSTTNIFTYVMNPSQLIGLAFEGIVNGVRACWQWFVRSEHGASLIGYLHQHYFQYLDRTDKSVIQFICVLAVAIPILGRLYYGSAPSPLLVFAFVGLLSGCYRLMKNRKEFRLNQDLVAEVAAIRTTLNQAVHHNTPYSQTLNALKIHIDESRFSHLKQVATHFDRLRGQFESANGRRPLDEIKNEFSDYLDGVIAFFPHASVGNVRCTAFRAAMNNLGANNNNTIREAYEQSYQELLTIQLPLNHRARIAALNHRARITGLKNLIDQALDQPTYERCRQDLIGWLERFQTRIEERLPYWKVVIPFPDPEPLE